MVLFSDPVTARVGDLGPPLYVASTALVFVAVLRNLAIRGMPLVAAGAASNLAAIVANGGYMPTSTSAAAEFGRSAPETYSNSAIVESPALAPLTDVIPLPQWLPFANIVSVGDILIAAGIVVVIAAAMRAGRLRPAADAEARRAGVSGAHGKRARLSARGTSTPFPYAGRGSPSSVRNEDDERPPLQIPSRANPSRGGDAKPGISDPRPPGCRHRSAKTLARCHMKARLTHFITAIALLAMTAMSLGAGMRWWD